jgi:hypothetical protein
LSDAQTHRGVTAGKVTVILGPAVPRAIQGNAIRADRAVAQLPGRNNIGATLGSNLLAHRPPDLAGDAP